LFNKSWYKFLAWSVASLYFLIMAGTIAGLFGQGPGEAKSMLWMQGMMQAMQVSIMGWAMESHETLNQVFVKTGMLVFPAIFAGGLLGLVIRLRRSKQHEG